MEKPNFEKATANNPQPESPKDVPQDKTTLDYALERFNKMLDDYAKKGKQLKEIIPKERNFDISMQETGDGVKLELRNRESGGTLDLKKFLPPGYSFAIDPKNSFYCLPPKKQ